MEPEADSVSVLHGDRVVLRRAAEADVPRLTAILAQPEVAVWWGAHGEAAVRRDFIDPEGGVTAYAIEVKGEDQVIGLVQYGEENDPAFRHANIDIFLDPGWHGRGLGSDAVRIVARHLFTACGHHRLTIDPAADNHRAIRAYERVGFKPVGVMRRYWRDNDGCWRDGLLMDMLVEELT